MVVSTGDGVERRGGGLVERWAAEFVLIAYIYFKFELNVDSKFIELNALREKHLILFNGV